MRGGGVAEQVFEMSGRQDIRSSVDTVFPNQHRFRNTVRAEQGLNKKVHGYI